MNPELLKQIKSLAENDKGWAIQEAQKLKKRLQKTPKAEVLFETGYGPSGLPHIGTFGEVFRTTMVRYAFSLISDTPTRLICFSDDLDGLRKIPDNVPNHDMLKEHLHKPLTQVPDPYEKYNSFGEHNNAMLKRFLDSFGFGYEFVSSTETYKSGRFDDMLLQLLQKYDEVLAVMLPTLGAERQATYSPFLPICPESGHVLQVPVIDMNKDAGTITYKRDDGAEIVTKVTGGLCKLQWKPDWGMRWVALGVDYEMSGKDLSESVILSAKIAKILGGTPPEGFSYELFLDQDGQKISKSKGNGLGMDEWLRYAPKESLSYFMYLKPKTAKRLYFDVIPKAVDEMLQFLASANTDEATEDNAKKLLANPLFFIRQGELQNQSVPVSFSLLLTLVNAGNISDADTLSGFISRYSDSANAGGELLEELMQCALTYYEDFVADKRQYDTAIAEHDLNALRQLAMELAELDDEAMADSEEVQKIVFKIGRDFNYDPMRGWFIVLYKALLGLEQGPRMGTLFAILGKNRSLTLIDDCLKRNA